MTQTGQACLSSHPPYGRLRGARPLAITLTRSGGTGRADVVTVHLLHYQHPTRDISRSRIAQLGYYVENHQQYLAKNPCRYRCRANTGVRFPETA